MSLLARVTEDRHGDVHVAVVEGEVDASNAVEIGGLVRAMLTNHSKALVVDLTATTYLDSAGINLLFELDRELRERQQMLHLVIGRGSRIRRVVAITALDSAVPTHESRDAALEQAQ